MPSDINRLRQQSLMQNYGLTMGGQMPGIQYQQQQAQYDPSQDPYFDEGPQRQEQPVYQPPPAPAPTAPSEKGGVRSNMIDELVGLTNRLYTPETRASNRYNELLDSAPEINKPGMGRGLLAGLAAFGQNAKGKDLLETTNGILYAPYIRDVAAWKEKADPFYKAAELEGRGNATERQLASGMATNLTTWQKNEQANEIAQQRAANDRIRAQAYALKAENWTIKIQGDRVVGYDPMNPGVPVDLGPSGGLDKRDELILQGNNAMNRIIQQGQDAMARTVQQGQDAMDRTVQAGANAAATKATAPGINPNDPRLQPDPKDEELFQQQEFERLRETTDAGRKWIAVKGGVYSMKNPPPKVLGTMFGGPNQGKPNPEYAEWESVRDAIYSQTPTRRTPQVGDQVGQDDTVVTPIITGPQTKPNVPAPAPGPGRARSGGAGPNTGIAPPQNEHDAAVQAGTHFYVRDATGKILGTVPVNDTATIAELKKKYQVGR